MTKEQALNRIRDITKGIYVWSEIRQPIREILDQIDQPQPDFTVRELVELLEKIDAGCWVEIDGEATWNIRDSNGAELLDSGIDRLKATLTALANPQPPSDKVAVMIDRKLAEFIADYRDGDLAEACREALKGTA
jgi:hypothetical protein